MVERVSHTVGILLADANAAVVVASALCSIWLIHDFSHFLLLYSTSFLTATSYHTSCYKTFTIIHLSDIAASLAKSRIVAVSFHDHHVPTLVPFFRTFGAVQTAVQGSSVLGLLTDVALIVLVTFLRMSHYVAYCGC